MARSPTSSWLSASARWSSCRPVRHTEEPRSSMAEAAASPIPRLPPVTIAVRPFIAAGMSVPPSALGHLDKLEERAVGVAEEYDLDRGGSQQDGNGLTDELDAPLAHACVLAFDVVYLYRQARQS